MKYVNDILIIEDSIDDLEMYERLLKKLMPNACVDVCEDAESALSQLLEDKKNYDLILMDYSLPGGVCGLSILKQLDNDIQIYHGPIIMLTGQGNENVAVECLRYGARDYLPKKCLSMDSLGRAIHNALEKHRAEKIAREKEHELNVFAQTLAHDLKAPLGRADAYLKALGKKHNLYEDMFFQNIKEDIDYTLLFLKRLVEYTQQGRSTIEMQPVHIENVVQKSIDNLEVLIRERGAHVSYHNLPEVDGDEVALIQFFQNMISNAIKYNHQQQPEIIIECQKDTDNRNILIHDNGIGVPPEKAQEIFEPFKRLSSDGEDHMGLGLALCQKIAHQHKGIVSVTPREGGGSTFCLSL